VIGSDAVLANRDVKIFLKTSSVRGLEMGGRPVNSAPNEWEAIQLLDLPLATSYRE